MGEAVCNPDNCSGQLRKAIAFAIDDLETQRFRHTWGPRHLSQAYLNGRTVSIKWDLWSYVNTERVPQMPWYFLKGSPRMSGILT